MAICHPETTKFKSTAATWGCEHEETARTRYQGIFSVEHENFEVSGCGFFINHEYPFLGASPDGLVTCSCCFDGICEIKVCVYIYCVNSHVYACLDVYV